MTRACVLLARAPSAPGKTRLTAHLARDAAVALRRAILFDTYEAVSAAGEAVIVAFTPDGTRPECEALLPGAGTRFIPQRGDDLGARMHNAISDAFALGAARVVLVGSDLPSLPPTRITDAFAALDAHDVVLGPSEDGGYYAIGIRRPDERLFANIEWGGRRVLEDTLAAVTAVQLTVARLAPWFDVDTRTDLARLQSDPRPDTARHTRDWVTRFSVG